MNGVVKVDIKMNEFAFAPIVHGANSRQLGFRDIERFLTFVYAMNVI